MDGWGKRATLPLAVLGIRMARSGMVTSCLLVRSTVVVSLKRSFAGGRRWLGYLAVPFGQPRGPDQLGPRIRVSQDYIEARGFNQSFSPNASLGLVFGPKYALAAVCSLPWPDPCPAPLEVVQGKRVVDFASGSGMQGIAAALAGAAEVRVTLGLWLRRGIGLGVSEFRHSPTVPYTGLGHYGATPALQNPIAVGRYPNQCCDTAKWVRCGLRVTSVSCI